MKVVHTIKDLQAELADKKNIVLVPTMGNLHDGHLQLMKTAGSARRHGCRIRLCQSSAVRTERGF